MSTWHERLTPNEVIFLLIYIRCVLYRKPGSDCKNIRFINDIYILQKINEVLQKQIIAKDVLQCLTTNLEHLAQNCKKDNTNMFEHVSASSMAVLRTQTDKFKHLSDQVAECHIMNVEHQKEGNINQHNLH